MADYPMRIESSFPIPPGETVRETLQHLHMSQAELAARAGRPEKTISQICNGKRAITPETAIEFERVLGVPAHIWNKLERGYRAAIARIEEEKNLAQEAELARDFPYNEMAKLGWVEKTRDRIERARNLLRFFGVASLSLLDEQPAAVFRVGTCSDPSDCALIAWLRAGTLHALEMQTQSFDRGGVEKSVPLLRELTLQPVADAVTRVKDTLSEHGVAVALVPALPKTAAHGATHWLGTDKAILQLSDRYKRADIFWFSFFHEIGHLLLHGKRPGVYVNRTDRQHDAKEREADEFAAETLIPRHAYDELVSGKSFSAIIVRDFADAIGIHPGIVVGRLQHDGLIAHNRLNSLREEFDLSEIEHQ
ncbi:MAG: HigA family addiction module antitoxin [Armatimonadota bacterium]